MRGNRSELVVARKSPRCHVNTPLLPGEIYVIFSMETASACSTEITGGLPQRFLTGRKQTNYATDKTCKRETSARRVAVSHVI